MKIDYSHEKIIVYLLSNFDEDIEELCLNVINKLKKYFNIELKGFYDVNIYRDINYGTILEFVLEQSELYIDFTKVDLHISDFSNTSFLYEIEDILDVDVNKFYLYDNKYYISLNDLDIKNTEFGNLIYKDTDNIISKAKLIDM